MTGVVIYSLCALVSLACAVLLTRGYRANRTPLLFWSSLGFGLLAMNNLLLVLDLAVLPGADLRLWRVLSALAGLGVLAFGLIKESR